MSIFGIPLLVLLFLGCSGSGTGWSNALAMGLKTGVLLTDDQGRILYSLNKDAEFIPASILKILTSGAAIHHFGRDFRFQTRVAYDAVSKNLYVKGLGDPLFVSEVIQDLCRQILETASPESINDIILDSSFFSPDIRIPGTGNSLNPYDATTGALCANFNTIAFKWDPVTAAHVSAEPQTPLLPIFLKNIRATGQKKGRILLNRKQRSIYPGLLIKFFLEKKGVNVNGVVKSGIFWPGTRVSFIHTSPFSMEQVLQQLLKYSNNFIANQLMLTMGARVYKDPATPEKGLKALEDFAEKKIGLKDIKLAEASGLSRLNRLTPTQMVKILTVFMPYYPLLRKKGNEYYKTGTLSDVRCRAGYIMGKNKRLYPFAIMINGRNKTWESIRRDLIKRVRSL